MLSFVPKRLKRAIKGRIKSLRHGYVTRWHAFGRDDLLGLLARLGLRPGDVVVVHSSADRFEGFRGSLLEVVEALQEAVEPEGTILMPTLPFDGSAIDYAREGRTFDAGRTPSKMGLITELFRRSPGVVRSLHPTHSVAARGPKAAELIADHHRADTPCGPGTPWGRLPDHQGKVLLLGTGIAALTFFHAIEAVLEPSMPFSPFTTERFRLRSRGEDGTVLEVETRLFDREISARRNLGPLAVALKARGSWHEGRVGRLDAILLDAREVLEAARSLARERVYCYDLDPAGAAANGRGHDGAGA
jgi:aminoglycoside 3-N-acetyltransferase